MQGLKNFERTLIDCTKVYRLVGYDLIDLTESVTPAPRPTAYRQVPGPKMVIPPPGSVHLPPSTMPDQSISMPASYPSFPGGFVLDSLVPSGPMPQGPIGDYPVVPQGGVILSEAETSEGLPVIPPRPQH